MSAPYQHEATTLEGRDERLEAFEAAHAMHRHVAARIGGVSADASLPEIVDAVLARRPLTPDQALSLGRAQLRVWDAGGAFSTASRHRFPTFASSYDRDMFTGVVKLHHARQNLVSIGERELSRLRDLQDRESDRVAPSLPAPFRFPASKHHVVLAEAR